MSAWKVWTWTICWKRLRQMRTKQLSSLEAAASCAVTSCRKKRSRESGCLWITYFMPTPSCGPSEDEERDEWPQFSLRVDFWKGRTKEDDNQRLRANEVQVLTFPKL